MKNRFGNIGVVVGLIALTAAFLSPWIVDMLEPDVPAEATLVDFVLKVKDAALAKAKGEAYVGEPQKKTPADFVAPTVIGFGMIGIALGVGGLVREEKRLLSGTAIALGLSAAIVQWSIIVVALIVIVTLVAIVLNHFGIDFDL